MEKNGSQSTGRGRAIAILRGSLKETPRIGRPPGGPAIVEAELEVGKQTIAVIARGPLAEQLGHTAAKTELRIVGDLAQQTWDTKSVKHHRMVVVAAAVKEAAPAKKGMIDRG